MGVMIRDLIRITDRSHQSRLRHSFNHIPTANNNRRSYLRLANIYRQLTTPMGTWNPKAFDHNMRSMPQKGSEHHSQPRVFNDLRLVEAIITHIVDYFWYVIKVDVCAFCYPASDAHTVMVATTWWGGIEALESFGKVVDCVAYVRVH